MSLPGALFLAKVGPSRFNPVNSVSPGQLPEQQMLCIPVPKIPYCGEQARNCHPGAVINTSGQLSSQGTSWPKKSGMQEAASTYKRTTTKAEQVRCSISDYGIRKVSCISQRIPSTLPPKPPVLLQAHIKRVRPRDSLPAGNATGVPCPT